jgi:Cu-processing system permease protein
MSKVLAVAGVTIKELYRRKDFYVLFVMTVLIALVMGFGGNFTRQKNVSSDLKEICLLLVWISALAMAVGMTARQIPAERDNRTLFPLLAKPVTRGQLILGKFLGCWLANGFSLAVLYVPLAIISGSIEHSWPVADYLEALWLQWAFLSVVIALVLFGSLVVPSTSSNATLCAILVAGILLGGRYLSGLALWRPEPVRTVLYTIYFLIPHLEWSDIREIVSQNRVPEDAGYLCLASVYFACYTALFLYAAWLSFRRKALN